MPSGEIVLQGLFLMGYLQLIIQSALLIKVWNGAISSKGVCGNIIVVDIGIPKGYYDTLEFPIKVIDKELVSGIIPKEKLIHIRAILDACSALPVVSK